MTASWPVRARAAQRKREGVLRRLCGAHVEGKHKTGTTPDCPICKDLEQAKLDAKQEA